MRITLLALFTSLCLALAGTALQAQPGSGQGGGPGLGGGGGMRMNPEARVQQLIEQLAITPEQEPAFRAAMAQINEQQMAAMQGMRQGGGQGGQGGGQGQGQGAQGDPGQGGGQGGGQGQGMQRRAQMQEQAETLLAPVLTAEQMARFRELEAERMNRMQQRNAP